MVIIIRAILFLVVGMIAIGGLACGFAYVYSAFRKMVAKSSDIMHDASKISPEHTKEEESKNVGK